MTKSKNIRNKNKGRPPNKKWYKMIKEGYLKGWSIARIRQETYIRHKIKPMSHYHVKKVIKELGLVRLQDNFREQAKLIVDIDADKETAKQIITAKKWKNVRMSTIVNISKGCIDKEVKYRLLRKLKEMPDNSFLKVIGQDTNIHHSLYSKYKSN